MLQRICPVCDQKMKFAHYCTNCRSWVSHPWLREVDYYLNERHPAGETGCTYHQPETPDRSQPSSRPASRTGNAQGKTAGSQKRTPARSTGTFDTAPAKTAGAYGSAPTESARPFSKPIGKTKDPKVVLLILILIAVIRMLADLGASLVSTVSQKVQVQEYDIDLGLYGTEEYEYSYEELSDEEARAAGKSCNGSAHFGIQGKDVEQAVKKALEACGCGLAGIERYSSNGRDSDGTTWYDSYTVLMVREQVSDTQPYIEIGYDTVTGELHSVYVNLEKREDVLSVLEAFLRLMAEGEQPELPEGYEEQMSDVVVPLMAQTESFTYEFGDLELYGSNYDSIYSLSIWRSYED